VKRARTIRRICCIAAIVCAYGALASAASAATFYVTERTGKDSNSCLSGHPCLTIGRAIVAAEATPGPNTIDVAEGTYTEVVDLDSAADTGLTIDGEPGEDVEIVHSGEPPVIASAPAASVTLANLRVKNQAGVGAVVSSVIEDHGVALTLDGVIAQNENLSGVNGIEVRDLGSLTMNGGEVIMEAGTRGAAIVADETPLALSEMSLKTEGGTEAGGILSTRSALSVVHSSARIEQEGSEELPAIKAEEDGSVSLTGDDLIEEGAAPALELVDSPTTADDVTVEMDNPGSEVAAVGDGSHGGSSTFDHLEVGGNWLGPAFEAQGGDVTLADSHLIADTAHNLPAIEYLGAGEGQGLVLQRSIVQAGPKAEPGALVSLSDNVTIDSSEILGGTNGILFENSEGGTRTLTLAASTVDAGAAGLADDAFGIDGVNVDAKGTSSSTADASIEGSIVLEQQAATAEAGNHASVTCSYSALPSQTQPAKATEGAVACASGANGNTNSSAEFASLFSQPFTNYQLNPSSNAVDSVPVSAITLPFGLTPSTTDREGHPRFEEIACALVQDKGALELPGHATGCPKATPLIAGPQVVPLLKGVLSALTISPDAFPAAPAGTTVSAATANTKKSKKRRYGTTISYRDSQAATATFTVLRESAGREQGKSCRKPSAKNRHGKRCALLTKVGSFTHADEAGANGLRFSGRLNGGKLPPATYELQAVAHDAAGNGATVEKSFKIAR
jgi:hypothetical protein